MSKTELIKSSGWFFVAAAFAFITILTGSDPIAIPGSVISAILLAVGMSRLRAAYGQRASSFGRSMLLLGILGPALWLVGIVFMGLMGVEAVQQGLWVLLFAAPAFSLLGLTLFGLTALISRPMPRLNWLPVLAGIWYPVMFTLFSIYDIAHQGRFPDKAVPALISIVVIQFVALCVLGFVLIDDSSEELVSA